MLPFSKQETTPEGIINYELGMLNAGNEYRDVRFKKYNNVEFSIVFICTANENFPSQEGLGVLNR